MAWGGFAIALLLAYLVQVGIAALLPLQHFDAFLVLALLCGLVGPTHDARLAAWLTGLAQDLGSADALGIHAFTLGLSGLLLTKAREIGNVGVWWVRGLAALVAAWPGQLLYLLHLHYYASGSGEVSFWSLVLTATYTSLVAALLATLINGLPGAMQRRRRYRALRM